MTFPQVGSHGLVLLLSVLSVISRCLNTIEAKPKSSRSRVWLLPAKMSHWDQTEFLVKLKTRSDPAEPPTWWRRLQVAATSRSDNQSPRRCGAIRAAA